MSLAKGTASNNSGAGVSSLNVGLSGANTTTAGRGLVAIVRYHLTDPITLDSITVSGQSNMTIVGTRAVDTANNTVQVGYLGNNTGGGDKTITANFGGGVGNAVMSVMELYDTVSGAITTDGSGLNATGASSTPTGTLTTGSA